MTTILYADVTCPACYLASLRTDLLQKAQLETPQWRLVEHRPGVRLTPVVPDDDTQRERERELAAVRAMVRAGERIDDDALPQHVPPALPSTSAAVAAFAEASHAGVDDVARRLLFGAYWQDGLDIGSSSVLRALLLQPIQSAVAARREKVWPRGAWRGAASVAAWTGNLVSIQGGPITTAGERLIALWRKERRAITAPACLTLVTDAHDVLSGAAALDALLLPDHLLAAAESTASSTARPTARVTAEDHEPPLAAAG